MKQSTLKYFFAVHSGIIFLAALYLISGYNLSSMFVSLPERFNIVEVDGWSFNTISYAYVDFIIFSFFCLCIYSIKKGTPVTPKRVFVSSVIAAPIVFFTQFNLSFNSVLEISYLSTIYHWLFTITLSVFIYCVIIRKKLHVTQIFVHFKTMIFFGFLIFVHGNFIVNGLYPLRNEIVADQMSIAEDLIKMTETVRPESFVESVNNLKLAKSSTVTWGANEEMPYLDKDINDVFLANANDFTFAWHYEDGEVDRSNPTVKLKYVARSNGINYFSLITINIGSAKKIYVHFYQMIYVATIAFILVWTLILSYILNKHLEIRIIKNVSNKKKQECH